MVRTQIYIPQNQHKEITLIAKEKNQPMAEIIRAFIRKGLKEESSLDKTGLRAMKKISSMRLKDGDTSLSSNIDHYLYGGLKK